jgi:phosphatidylinositol alpha 1,6-mannosyltransferase
MPDASAVTQLQHSDSQIAAAVPRVAFLADTFHEVNGAARTCRELTAFANRRGYPFFSVRFAKRESFAPGDSFSALELRRSPVSVGVDPDLRFDLTFFRLRSRLEERLRAFAPNVIHVIGPGELGILGAIAAWRMHVPLVVSWHTNIHEYAARRLPFAPSGLRPHIQEFVLSEILRLYQRGAALLAPSPELVDMLRRRTGKQAFLMTRGVDSAAFSPERRRRTDDAFVIGYIGRLMPEKGVRFFTKLERFLESAGISNFRIFIAGWGSEERWLRRHLRHAEFQGILDPEALGRAYANMDLFIFPSRTDTFGNVVQEALASRVPALVTNGGGPQTIVDHGVTGFIAANEDELCQYALRLMRNAEERMAMGAAGRERMLTRSWDDVFEKVYQTYSYCIDRGAAPVA